MVSDVEFIKNHPIAAATTTGGRAVYIMTVAAGYTRPARLTKSY